MNPRLSLAGGITGIVMVVCSGIGTSGPEKVDYVGTVGNSHYSRQDNPVKFADDPVRWVVMNDRPGSMLFTDSDGNNYLVSVYCSDKEVKKVLNQPSDVRITFSATRDGSNMLKMYGCPRTFH